MFIECQLVYITKTNRSNNIITVTLLVLSNMENSGKLASTNGMGTDVLTKYQVAPVQQEGTGIHKSRRKEKEICY